MTKKLINQFMKGRVNFGSIYTVEIRFEAWDYVSENGITLGNLSNELVMIGVQLLKLSVELLGMSVCDKELGCTCGELRHGLFEHCFVRWSEMISENESTVTSRPSSLSNGLCRDNEWRWKDIIAGRCLSRIFFSCSF